MKLSGRLSSLSSFSAFVRFVFVAVGEGFVRKVCGFKSNIIFNNYETIRECRVFRLVFVAFIRIND